MEKVVGRHYNDPIHIEAIMMKCTNRSVPSTRGYKNYSTSSAYGSAILKLFTGARMLENAIRCRRRASTDYTIRVVNKDHTAPPLCNYEQTAVHRGKSPHNPLAGRTNPNYAETEQARQGDEKPNPHGDV